MALVPAPTSVRASRAVPGRRRDAERVVIAINDALAPCAEGIAFADDVAAGVERITDAAMAGSRMAVMNEANRLAHRALGYRAEFQKLAADIEGRS